MKSVPIVARCSVTTSTMNALNHTIKGNTKMSNVTSFDISNITKEQNEVIDRELSVSKTTLIASLSQLLNGLIELHEGESNEESTEKLIGMGVIQMDILDILTYSVAQDNGIEEMELAFAERVFGIEEELRKIVMSMKDQYIGHIAREYINKKMELSLKELAKALESNEDVGNKGVLSMEELIKYDMKKSGITRTQARKEFMEENPVEQCDKCDSVNCFLNPARDEELKDLG